jgi:iron complex outermembrane receptor protein
MPFIINGSPAGMQAEREAMRAGPVLFPSLGFLLVIASGAGRCAQPQQAPEVVVSATRFETPVNALAINASVITAEEIARSTARNLPDLLRSRAGITSRDLFGNNGASATVDIRGFGASASQNTLILVDGRRLTDPDLSTVQWSSIPLEMIERVEILRGSGAVQYGDGASAGAINIITRGPGREGTRAGGSVRAGSWDTYEVAAHLHAAGKQMALAAFAQNYQSNGYRDNNYNRQSNVALTGTWTGSTLDANLRLALDRQGIRLPGARTVQPSANIDQVSTDRRGTSTPLDYAQRNGNQATLDLQRQLGAGEFIVGLGYRDKDQRSYFDFGGFPDYRDIDLSVLSLQPRYRLRTDTFGVTHSIVIGADLAHWNYQLLRSNAASNIGRPFNTIDADQDNTGVYVLDTIKITDDVSVTAGARREWQKVSASDVFDAGAPGGAFGSGAPAGEDSLKAWAGELGVRVRVAPQTALIARAGRSLRFANVDEIYESSPMFSQQFQFLQPQTAQTYELGFALGDQLPWLRAALFLMDVDNEIHLDPFSTGVGNRNMPPIRRKGFELEVHRDVAPVLGLTLAYSYTQAKFREGTLPGSPFTQQNVQLADRTVPLVPQNKLNLAAQWRVTPRTDLRAEARYIGSQFMENDEGNTLGRKIPDYTVTDVKLTHRAGALKMSAAIDNLFGRKYYTYAVRSQFVLDRFNAYPLPERAFWLTLEASL